MSKKLYSPKQYFNTKLFYQTTLLPKTLHQKYFFKTNVLHKKKYKSEQDSKMRVFEATVNEQTNVEKLIWVYVSRGASKKQNATQNRKGHPEKNYFNVITVCLSV